MKKSYVFTGFFLIGLLLGFHNVTAQEFGFEFAQTLGSDECFGVAFGDVDGDGDRDGVLVNFQGPSRLWTNLGDGTFVDSGQRFETSTAHSGQLGDLDGDGDLDLFIASTMDVDKIWLNNGQGLFSESQQLLGTADDLSVQVLLGDVDLDGDLDAVVARNMHPSKIWYNDGEGIFDTSSEIGNATTYYQSIADVDGDGDLDIYLEYLNNPDRIFLNDGAGNFTDSGQEIGLATGEGHGVFYDLDLDGDQDLMLPNHENGAQVFTNIGTGQFEACGDPFGEGSIAGILDADLDGLPDLITSNFLGSTNFYKNFDNCLYRPYGNLFPDEVCWSISTEDVDGDGDMDVILGNTSMNGSATKLFLNRMINTSVELTYAFVEQELKVYPNPASDFFQIDYEISTPGDYHIQLVNILSQETTLLVSGLISEGTKTLKFGTQNRPTGHYLCELLKDGIVIASKKLCLIK